MHMIFLFERSMITYKCLWIVRNCSSKIHGIWIIILRKFEEANKRLETFLHSEMITCSRVIRYKCSTFCAITVFTIWPYIFDICTLNRDTKMNCKLHIIPDHTSMKIFRARKSTSTNIRTSLRFMEEKNQWNVK